MYYIGQGFGFLAMICNIVAPMFKKKEHMLWDLILLNLFTMLNFLLIGRYGSAVWLYIVAIVQCFSSLRHVTKATPVRPSEIALFFVAYVSLGMFGLLSANGFSLQWTPSVLLEFIPILGSILSMTTIFIKDAQLTRLFVLFTSIVWMVYSAIVGAAAFFSDGACAVTTVIALLRYRKQK